MGIPIKLVALGDGNVGKTSLFITYYSGVFPGDYLPTLFDESYEKQVTVNETPVTLQLYELPGHEEYASLRYLSYPHTDVFLLCFSLIRLSSYENIRDNWYPDVSYHSPNTPVILVGTKLDLLDDEETLIRLKEEEQVVPITTAEGLDMGKQINAVKYMECSSLTQNGLKELFEEAIRIGISNKKPPKKKRECVVL